MDNDVYFRAGVGAIITDVSLQKILLFQRRDYSETWQPPQGGINAQEDPLRAVFREVFEETGIEEQELQLLFVCPFWVGYDFSSSPSSSANAFKAFGGQVHRWYLMQLKTTYSSFRQGHSNEFVSSSWCDISCWPEKTSPFKKEAAEILVRWFRIVTGSLNHTF